MCVGKELPSAVLIVKIPVLESNDVDETPATATVPILSINPEVLIVSTGICDADPYVAESTVAALVKFVNVPESAVTDPVIAVPTAFVTNFAEFSNKSVAIPFEAEMAV